jgi:hypothetical protein
LAVKAQTPEAFAKLCAIFLPEMRDGQSPLVIQEKHELINGYPISVNSHDPFSVQRVISRNPVAGFPLQRTEKEKA